MNERRKGFLMYADYSEYFDMMNSNELGDLIKQFFRYAAGKDADTKDFTQSMLFVYIMIRQNFDRDTEKYDKTRENRSLAAKQREQKKHETLSGSKPSYDVYEIEQQSYEKYRNL